MAGLLAFVNQKINLMNDKTKPNQFMAFASKSQAKIAAELADEIKAVIYKHSGEIPLALALGVLKITEQDLINNAEDQQNF